MGDGADQAAAEVVVGDQGVVVGGEGGGELLEQGLEGGGEAGEPCRGARTTGELSSPVGPGSGSLTLSGEAAR